MASVVGALTGGITGNSGGSGINYQAGAANLQIPATTAQATDLYNQAQNGLTQQQSFVNALNAQNGLGNQSSVYNQLQGVANGTGPNPAQAQLAQATGANTANQAALMAGQRGASQNVGLIARQAAQQGAANQQNAAGQASTLQANQSLNALNQLGGLANTQVAQQQAGLSGLNSATQNEQSNILGSIQGSNQAQVGNQSSINSANAQIANTVAQGQESLLGNITGAAGSTLGLIGGGLGAAGSWLGGGASSLATGAGTTVAGGAADVGGAASAGGAADAAVLAAANGGMVPSFPGGQGYAQGGSVQRFADGTQNNTIQGIPSVPVQSLDNSAQVNAQSAQSNGPQSNVGRYMHGQSNPNYQAPAQQPPLTGMALAGNTIGTGLNAIGRGVYNYFHSSNNQNNSGNQNNSDNSDNTDNSETAQNSIDSIDLHKSQFNPNIDTNQSADQSTNPSTNNMNNADNEDNIPTMNAAHGGRVPAMVSPGEKYLPPKDVKKVEMGADPMKVGKTIPGKPKVKGAKNSYANDTIPATLEEGGIVLPRSVTQAKHPHWAAHQFVSQLMAKQGKSLPKKSK